MNSTLTTQEVIADDLAALGYPYHVFSEDKHLQSFDEERDARDYVRRKKLTFAMLYETKKIGQKAEPIDVWTGKWKGKK